MFTHFKVEQGNDESGPMNKQEKLISQWMTQQCVVECVGEVMGGSSE